MRTVSGAKPKLGDEVRHFVGSEGGAEGVGEEAALVGRGFGGVGGDELRECDFVVWAGQIAVKQQAAGDGHADGFGDYGPWFGEVVDDAVADDDGNDAGSKRVRSASRLNVWRRRGVGRCGR